MLCHSYTYDIAVPQAGTLGGFTMGFWAPACCDFA